VRDANIPASFLFGPKRQPLSFTQHLWVLMCRGSSSSLIDRSVSFSRSRKATTSPVIPIVVEEQNSNLTEEMTSTRLFEMDAIRTRLDMNKITLLNNMAVADSNSSSSFLFRFCVESLFNPGANGGCLLEH